MLRNLFLPVLSILSVCFLKLRVDIGLSAIAATSWGPMREKPRTKLRHGIYLANRAVSVAWNCDSCSIVLKQSEMSPVDLISGYGNYFHLRDLCLPPSRPIAPPRAIARSRKISALGNFTTLYYATTEPIC